MKLLPVKMENSTLMIMTRIGLTSSQIKKCLYWADVDISDVVWDRFNAECWSSGLMDIENWACRKFGLTSQVNSNPLTPFSIREWNSIK